MRLRAGLLLAALLDASQAQAAPSDQPIRKFIARIYTPYMREPRVGPDIEQGSRIYSRSLRRLFDEDAARSVTNSIVLEADPLCACQDWGHFHYTITSISGSSMRRLVFVKLRNYGTTTRQTLVLIPGGRFGYQIDDILGIYKPSLKPWLRAALLDPALK